MKTSEKTTRQRLIDSAQERFYRDGFRNVGIEQIYSDVGISKTAFYKHFECKEDLMLAVLEDQERWLGATVAALLAEHGGSTAVSQLRTLFDLVELVTERQDWRGCIFVNVSMEFPLPHDPVHQAAHRAKALFECTVRDIAERGGAADPAAFARELCMVIEGAYVTRHLTRDPGTIHVARRLGEMVITKHLPSVVGEPA